MKQSRIEIIKKIILNKDLSDGARWHYTDLFFRYAIGSFYSSPAATLLFTNIKE